MHGRRDFTVDTPVGRLRARAKHQTDDPAFFPGVFIELIRDGKDPIPIACVEYASVYDCIRAVFYEIGEDERAFIQKYDPGGEE